MGLQLTQLIEFVDYLTVAVADYGGHLKMMNDLHHVRSKGNNMEVNTFKSISKPKFNQNKTSWITEGNISYKTSWINLLFDRKVTQMLWHQLYPFGIYDAYSIIIRHF